MIINIKQEFIDRSINRLPTEMLDVIRCLNDDEYTITITSGSSSTATTVSSTPVFSSPSRSNDSSVIDSINQTITMTYSKIIRINSLSTEDKTVIQNIIEDLRTIVMRIYNSMTDRIENISNELELKAKQIQNLEHEDGLKAQKIQNLEHKDGLKAQKIQNLEHEVENLKAEMIKVNPVKQELIERKKVNMIAEIMTPMKKRIYTEMQTSNIICDYYDANLLKSFYWLVQDDRNSSEFYLNIYKTSNSYSEEDCRRFQQLLLSISTQDSLEYPRLLKFLIEKEKRNFSEHSALVDFLRDARQTKDPKLITFLSQIGLLEHFESADIDMLDKTYQKYFGHLIRRI